MSIGEIFWNACCEEISLKSSSIKNHKCSTKKLVQEKKGSKSLQLPLIKIHNAEVCLVSEALPGEQQVFRVKVVTTFFVQVSPKQA